MAKYKMLKVSISQKKYELWTLYISTNCPQVKKTSSYGHF